MVERWASKSDADRGQAATVDTGSAAAVFFPASSGSFFGDRETIRVTPAVRRPDNCCAAALRAEEEGLRDMIDILP
jgi:hypothetical protein